MYKYIVVLLLALNISSCSIISTWTTPESPVDKSSVSIEVQNFVALKLVVELIIQL